MFPPLSGKRGVGGVEYNSMNRIDQKFKDLKKAKKKAFIAFITAGDPDLKTTGDMIIALEKAGADIIELGVPFSDPLADGPTIQLSYQRSLKKGTNIDKILQVVRQVRPFSQVPIAFMSSYNPIFHYGEEKFIKAAKAAEVDGLIIPDLPPEEASVLIKLCRKHNIALVFFLSPTTTPQRMKKIVKVSTGFIYYVSLTGVTGARAALPDDILSKIKSAKRATQKPICVGFGISTPEQVREISKVADGVIVGSAIVKEIEKHLQEANVAEKAAELVSRLTQYRK